MTDAKTVIAARAGRDLKDGQIINLGIGLPTLIGNYVPEGVDVIIQTENGAIGVGPAPSRAATTATAPTPATSPSRSFPGAATSTPRPPSR